MCKVLYRLHTCGHPASNTFPHTPCEPYLEASSLSGLDPAYKTLLRQCRASRERKVKVLNDDFCVECDARLCALDPRQSADLARRMMNFGLLKGQELKVWLVESVEVAQWREDRMVEEEAVDSECDETDEEDPEDDEAEEDEENGRG